MPLQFDQTRVLLLLLLNIGLLIFYEKILSQVGRWAGVNVFITKEAWFITCPLSPRFY